MNFTRLFRFIGFGSILFWILAPLSAWADTTVGGTIDMDTTWTLSGSPYVVASNITVKGTDGADGITTLTIDPGVTVKFNQYIRMYIGASSGDPGALVAQGEAGSPIVFTSNKAEPAAGDWYYIRFYNTTDDATTVMEHCTVEYGGLSNGSLYFYQASPTIRNVTIQNSKSYGIDINNSEPVIENCIFNANQNYDLYYSGTIGGSVAGSTISNGISLLATGTVDFSGNIIHQNNGFPIKANADMVGAIVSGSSITDVDADSYLQVSAGTISHDATWTAAIPYTVIGNITVKGTDGADGITTLTIDPGVTVKFNQYIRMYIGASSGDPGALVAQGEAGSPIVFTSNKAEPAPGDWYYIQFYNTTDDATTVMEHCTVEYGGLSNGSLYFYQASPTIRNVTIQNSKSYGIDINNSEPVIENCIFNANQNYDLYYSGTIGGSVAGSTISNGISLLATGTVDFSGNIIHQNNGFPIKANADMVGAIVSGSSITDVDADSYLQVSAGTISHDATWTAAMPYAVIGNITVKGTDGADGITTLTIDPGVVVKFNQYRYMDIGASSGDPGALVAQGEAVNPIVFTSNKATPAPGDWYYIRFYNTTDDAASAMVYCVVEFGGYSNGAIYLYDASPRIQNTTVRNSNSAGIYARGGGTAAATVNCNTFVGNQNGIYWADSPPPEMHDNNFNGNNSYGLYYSGAQILDAENNWWGDADGPNTGGDSAYGNVDSDPWADSEKQCGGSGENYPPFPPASPVPADHAVRVISEGGVGLSWTGNDPNSGDTLAYDLFWGATQENLQLQAQNLTDASYSMTGLSRGGTYFWKVIAKDSGGLSAEGEVWRFTTDGDPPDLVVAAITTIPAGGMSSNSMVTVAATITNVGNGPVVDDFVTEFKADNSLFYSSTTSQVIAAGGSIQISQNWYYRGGDPVISVSADTGNSVVEVDEGNNQTVNHFSVIADITPPAVLSFSPISGGVYQSVEQIAFTLDDSQNQVDDAAVLGSFSVVGPFQQPVGGNINENDDNFSFIPGTLPLSDGDYQVDFTAEDIHGNAKDYSFTFSIDSQPPSKPVIVGGEEYSGTIQPRPVQNIAKRVIVALEGTREANTSVWLNGVQRDQLGSDPWSFQVELSVGPNELEVYCIDEAGNQSESEWVDITAEVVSGIVYEYDISGRLMKIK